MFENTFDSKLSLSLSFPSFPLSLFSLSLSLLPAVPVQICKITETILTVQPKAFKKISSLHFSVHVITVNNISLISSCFMK